MMDVIDWLVETLIRDGLLSEVKSLEIFTSVAVAAVDQAVESLSCCIYLGASIAILINEFFDS